VSGSSRSEFVQLPQTALRDKKQMHVLNVLLDQADRSPAMVRLAKRLAKRLSPGK
jgi:hypothetical protein